MDGMESREEFSEGSGLSNHNEASKLSDAEDGANVDCTSINYLYQNETCL